jgi:DUF4097 and DUF4098 domain-containing protein YvlB
VHYEVHVPVDVDVVVHGDHRISVSGTSGSVEAVTDSGSIRVSDVTGALVLRSDNGGVFAERVRSEFVDARSDNGSVRVALLAPPRSVIASTDNGSVEVVVPRTADAYAVDVDSDLGSTRNDVRTDSFSARHISARSDTGSATVRYPTP